MKKKKITDIQRAQLRHLAFKKELLQFRFIDAQIAYKKARRSLTKALREYNAYLKKVM